MSKGLSFHIGLNHVGPKYYNGWNGELFGCINDARAMERLAKTQGYDATVMTDEQATSTTVLRAIGSAAQKLVKGDSYLLTYSYARHGSQVTDTTGDEEDLLGGFKFQVQWVNDGAIAPRLPGAWQSSDIFSGVCSGDRQWHSARAACSPTSPCLSAGTGAAAHSCSRGCRVATGCRDSALGDLPGCKGVVPRLKCRQVVGPLDAGTPTEISQDPSSRKTDKGLSSKPQTRKPGCPLKKRQTPATEKKGTNVRQTRMFEPVSIHLS